VVFEIMRAVDRQTDTQTDIQTWSSWSSHP